MQDDKVNLHSEPIMSVFLLSIIFIDNNIINIYLLDGISINNVAMYLYDHLTIIAPLH